MEVTAMTSADPVEVTAIRIMIHTMNSPVDPIRRCATAGATNPVVFQHNIVMNPVVLQQNNVKAYILVIKLEKYTF